MVLMAAIAAILIVSHCSEPPWNIWWLDFKNIWVDLKSPPETFRYLVKSQKRRFLVASQTFECEDFIHRARNWSTVELEPG